MTRIIIALLLAAGFVAPSWAQTRTIYMTGARPSTQGDPASLSQTEDFLQSKADAPKTPCTVFIGTAAADFLNLANPVTAAPLLAAGNICVYGHGNGMATLTTAGLQPQLRAVWGLPATNGGDLVGETGPFAPVPADYTHWFGGVYPAEIDVNVFADSGAQSGTWTDGSTGYMTADDLTRLKAVVDAARAVGAKSVAPFYSPNAGIENLAQPFATSGYWANMRAAIAYGGGLALDVPATYWAYDGFRPVGQYKSMIRQMIAWTVSQGYRASLVTSPYRANGNDASGNSQGCGYDDDFLKNVRALAADLTLNNTLPTQWVVESYCGYTAAGDTRNSTNPIALMGGPGSLQEVALYLAQAVRTAPLGTTPAGATGVAEAALLTSRVRRMHYADLPGAGTLGSQDSAKVNITGGSIAGVDLILTTAPLFLGGLIVQGADVAAILSGTSGTTGMAELLNTNGALASLKLDTLDVNTVRPRRLFAPVGALGSNMCDSTGTGVVQMDGANLRYCDGSVWMIVTATHP